jgi:VCBS repeat-containing protein
MNTRNIRTWKAVSVLVVLTMLISAGLFLGPVQVVQAVTVTYTPNGGSDASDGSATAFSIVDRNDLATSDNNRMTSDGTWPTGGYVESQYIEFLFPSPNAPLTATVSSAVITFEYQRSRTLDGAKLEVWNQNTSQWTDFAIGIPGSRDSDSTFDVDVSSVITTPVAANNFRFRFLAYRTSGTSPSTSHDLASVQIIYNTQPNTPTNAAPPDGATVTTRNPTFTWSDFSDPDAGDAQNQFHIQLRQNPGSYTPTPFREFTSGTSSANSYTPTTWDLPDGNYCWHVQVRDNSGASNALSDYSTETCFTVDATPPTSSASSPAYANAPFPVTASASDSGSAVANVRLYYRGPTGNWAQYGSAISSPGPYQWDFTPGLGDGTYYFQSVACDTVNNCETTPSGNTGVGDDSTVYDTTPPTSQATSPAYDNGGSIAVDWTASDAGGSGVANVVLWYRLNAGTWTDSGLSQVGGSGTFTFNPPGGSGTYCFYTIATDNALNVEAAPGGANGDGCTIFNTPPVAVDDDYRTLKNTPLIATQGDIAVPGVLDNDSDADGDALTAVQEAGPASGTLALSAGGSFVYTPTLNFTGAVTFTYHASDGTADSNIATVTITVTEFNYTPVAVADGYSTPEETPLTVAALGVLANDSDPDHDPLTAIREAGPSGGTLVLNANGSFVYTPTLNFNGVVTFTYHANDGIANSNTATVTITVTPLNDAPAFTSTPVISATEEAAYTYDVTATDVDNAVTDLAITAPTRPGWLTLADNGDGTATLTGTPTHTDIGDHPVVLQVSDGAATTTQPFTITVSAKGNYYVYLPVLFKNY